MLLLICVCIFSIPDAQGEQKLRAFRTEIHCASATIEVNSLAFCSISAFKISNSRPYTITPDDLSFEITAGEITQFTGLVGESLGFIYKAPSSSQRIEIHESKGIYGSMADMTVYDFPDSSLIQCEKKHLQYNQAITCEIFTFKNRVQIFSESKYLSVSVSNGAVVSDLESDISDCNHFYLILLSRSVESVTVSDGFTTLVLGVDKSTHCLNNPCGKHSTCTDSRDAYSCECDSGYDSPSGDGTGCILQEEGDDDDEDVDDGESTNEGSGSDADSSSGPGSSSGTDEGSDDGSESGAGAGAGSGSGSGSQVGSESGSDSESGSGSGSGSDQEGSNPDAGPAITCDDQPCGENSECISVVDGFECICNDGFTSSEEDSFKCVDVDECIDPETCGQHSTCTNIVGSFTCECFEGYRSYDGKGSSCHDVNECAESQACGANSICENSPGGYTCSCPDGFTEIEESIGCEDVNECNASPSPCGQDSICTNEDGSYTCECKEGFESHTNDGRYCVDIDECALSPDVCGDHASCSNSIGSFECSCSRGFVKENGSNVCVDVDECATSLCGSHSECTNNQGGFSCTCVHGYSSPTGDGMHCSVDDCSTENPCGSNSYCSMSEGQIRCDCHVGYRSDSGADCEEVNECDEGEPCGQHATCSNTPGSFTCECEAGFASNSEFGSNCEDVNECETLEGVCGDNSKCTNTEGSYECNCDDGYSSLSGDGRLCVDINECDVLGEDACSEHSQCVNAQGSFACECVQGYSKSSDGESCLDVDECSSEDNSASCGLHQVCSNTDGGYKCECADGYKFSDEIPQECVDVNECLSNMCGHHSICYNTQGSHVCGCIRGYQWDETSNKCVARSTHDRIRAILTSVTLSPLACSQFEVTAEDVEKSFSNVVEGVSVYVIISDDRDSLFITVDAPEYSKTLSLSYEEILNRIKQFSLGSNEVTDISDLASVYICAEVLACDLSMALDYSYKAVEILALTTVAGESGVGAQSLPSFSTLDATATDSLNATIAFLELEDLDGQVALSTLEDLRSDATSRLFQGIVSAYIHSSESRSQGSVSTLSECSSGVWESDGSCASATTTSSADSGVSAFVIGAAAAGGFLALVAFLFVASHIRRKRAEGENAPSVVVDAPTERKPRHTQQFAVYDGVKVKKTPIAWSNTPVDMEIADDSELPGDDDDDFDLNDLENAPYMDTPTLTVPGQADIPAGPTPSPSHASSSALTIATSAPTSCDVSPMPSPRSQQRERTRVRVAQEIVATERTYINMLDAVIQLYVEPLEELAPKDKILAKEEMDKMFSNIRMIRTLNSQFLSELETCIIGWTDADETTQRIGSIFLKTAPYFKMYTSYTNNFDAAMVLLSKKREGNKKFDEFCQRARYSQQASGLSLDNFLIAPIQRVPRYKLLLRELLKNTPESHMDRGNLQLALIQIETIATGINEAVRDTENRVIVWDIQNQFSGSVELVAPHRYFVKEGKLIKLCKNGHKEYTFFLFNDMIVYANVNVVGKYRLHKILTMNENFRVKKIPKQLLKNGLKITADEKSIAIACSSPEEQQIWYDEIYQCSSRLRKNQNIRKSFSQAANMSLADLLKTNKSECATLDEEESEENGDGKMCFAVERSVSIANIDSLAGLVGDDDMEDDMEEDGEGDDDDCDLP